MRVLMVSTSYPRDASDWRGIFIHHLVGAIARVEGAEVSLWAPPGDLPPGVLAATEPDESEWLLRLMQAGGISHLMRQRGVPALLSPVKLLRMLRRVYTRQTDVDLYHINWLQCALPLPVDTKPAVIAVLGNDLKLLGLPMIRGLLRRVMRRRKVAICPNADWMRAPLEAAFGDLATVAPVSFGIDAGWYTVERQPDWHKPLWLAVTRLTQDKLGPLFEWLDPLFRGQPRALHLFGPMQEEVEIPEWVNYHGTATPQQLLAEWFPRATGLVSLSRHAEGRPQVMLEAMAAGLPIVASRMPAHASLVFDDRTGALCDSPETCAVAIGKLEDPQINLRLGEAARRWASAEIGTWDDCAQRYADIYRTLLGNGSNA